MDKIVKMLLGFVLVLSPLLAYGQVTQQTDPLRWLQLTNKVSRPISPAKLETSPLHDVSVLPTITKASPDGNDNLWAMWASPLRADLPEFKAKQSWQFQKALAWQGEYPRTRVLTMGNFASLTLGWNRLSTSITSRLRAVITFGASKPTSTVPLVASPQWPSVTTQVDFPTGPVARPPVTLNWKID